MEIGRAEVLIALLVLAAVVLVANYSDRQPSFRPVALLLLLSLNALFTLFYASLPYWPTVEAKKIPPLVSILAIGFGAAATLLLIPAIRQRLVPLFPRRQGRGVGFDPDSLVHTTALIYCLYFLGDRVIEYVAAGGLSGLAQDTAAPTTSSLITTMGLFTSFAVLGVGIGLRRRISDTFSRLGLRAPTISELAAAAAVAFLMFCTEFVFGILWQAVASPDIIRQQTQVSQQLSNSITTLSAAFLLSSTAAIGEEIAFRGALQPIFGLWPTTIFFAMVHIQYTLTPATLLIVVVGLGLGWLRRRYNTTSSIVAHFLYNFVSAAFTVYARYFYNMSGFGP
jgi:membrane protease YdiL (CAAX protease family)